MSKWDGGQSGSQRGPEREDWLNLIEVVQGIQGGVEEATLQSVGALSSVTGLTVTEYGDGAVHKTVLTLDEVELTTTAGTTPATDGAWSTKQLYTFPTGTKALVSAGFKLSSEADNPGVDGITDTSDYDLGVGSVAVAQASAFSLSGTQSDYAEATVALVAGVSADDADTNVTPATHTATPLILNLRTVAEADHGATVAGLLKVSGTITILWTMVN